LVAQLERPTPAVAAVADTTVMLPVVKVETVVPAL
jgi:hypothetical protein